jgi:hypothetical protein
MPFLPGKGTLYLVMVVAWGYLLRYIARTHGIPQAQLYCIVTVVIGIVMNLSYKDREPGTLSAYPVFNPNCERLLGEMEISAFGPGHRNIGVSSSNAYARLNDPDRKFEDDEDERAFRKALVTQKIKLHQRCLCGSGKKFAACCEPLRIKLRQRGEHLRA